MPDAGGTYTRVHDWVQDDNAGIDIEATRMDAEDDSIATALNNRVFADGSAAPAANLPMGGFRHTGVGVGAARNDYPAISQVQDASLVYDGTDVGAVNDYDISLTPAYTAYTEGMTVSFKAANTNTGASTLNVNSLGAQSITDAAGQALTAADIVANGVYACIYDGTNFQILNVPSVEFADNSETQAGTITDKAVTPAGLASRTSTTVRTGIAALASQAEVDAGTEASKIVTPETFEGRVASTSISGHTRLATAAETVAGAASDVAVTPAGLSSRQASTTTAGIIETSTNAETQTGTETAVAVTPASLQSKTASATAIGLVELATDAEVATATDTTRAVTPAGIASEYSSLSNTINTQNNWTARQDFNSGIQIGTDTGVDSILSFMHVSGSLNFGSLNDGQTGALEITLTGVTTTSMVGGSPRTFLTSGMCVYFTPGTDAVQVRVVNASGGAIDLGAITFDVWAMRF